MIRVRNLTKTYNKNKATKFEALHNVDFSVKAGEMVALVGTSGAGKSTLLHILACMDTFECGEYTLHGENLEHASENQRSLIRNEEIGMVMQDFALIEELSVIDNVGIPLFFSKNAKKRKGYKHYARKALEEIGMEELAKKKVSQLSGGQKQRVAIARAIANNPNLILADEPTGALDTKTSKEVLAVFEKLHQSGRTIVIVTHDMNVAKRCERIIRIEDGRIVGEETG